MFGDVVISHAMGSGLTSRPLPLSAPASATSRFESVSDGRFVPVVVKISPMGFADRFQVLEGLNAGDEVVTSANFLIDSESRLEAGAGSMAGMPGMAARQTGRRKRQRARNDRSHHRMERAQRVPHAVVGGRGHRRRRLGDVHHAAGCDSGSLRCPGDRVPPIGRIAVPTSSKTRSRIPSSRSCCRHPRSKPSERTASTAPR